MGTGLRMFHIVWMMTSMHVVKRFYLFCHWTREFGTDHSSRSSSTSCEETEIFCTWTFCTGGGDTSHRPLISGPLCQASDSGLTSSHTSLFKLLPWVHGKFIFKSNYYLSRWHGHHLCPVAYCDSTPASKAFFAVHVYREWRLVFSNSLVAFITMALLIRHKHSWT